MASLDQFRLNIDAGWLPAWLLLTSIVSTANSISSYRSPSYHQQLYVGSSSNKAPSSPLASRTFGTWTFLSAVIRGYAAYNIDNPLIYDLAIWTYGIALIHFAGEVLVYKSAQAKGRMVFPLLAASSALTWMLTQRSYYLS